MPLQMGMRLGIPRYTGSTLDAAGGGGNYGLFDLSTDAGARPHTYLDFACGYYEQSSIANILASIPGYSFSRASTKYARTSGGVWTQFASGVPAITDKGYLAEGARTNLFLNSLAPATQTITLGATGSYTITCFDAGTAAVAAGTATITGAGTASPGSPVTINCTVIGTITVTITGSPFCVNVEAGAFGSSPIATAGASATRAADVLAFTISGVSYPATLFTEFERVVDTENNEYIFQADDGSSNNRSILRVDSSDTANYVSVAGGSVDGSQSVAGAIGLNSAQKFAARFGVLNDMRGARGGTLGAQDTSVAVPSTPSALRVGSSNTGSFQTFGYIRRAALWSNYAASDSQLQAMTPA